MTSELRGRTAIVTGAAKGIGRAFSTKLSSMGCQVAGVDVARQQLEALAGEIRERGDEFLPLAGDLADADVIEEIVDEVCQAFGGVDILINNAATMEPNKPVVGTAVCEWERALSINLRAPFLLAKAVIPVMIARGGGTIVNVVSGGSEVGIPGRAAYCASKAGLARLTETLADELEELAISVFALEPRRVETDAAAEARRGGLDLKPGRPPDDVLPALVFLLSDRAKHLSGRALHMDMVWLWSDD